MKLLSLILILNFFVCVEPKEFCTSVYQKDFTCVLNGEEYGINCVSCAAGDRCKCPENTYLQFISGFDTCVLTANYQRAFDLNWKQQARGGNGLETYCGQWSQCGYTCQPCPANTYNFHDSSCEGVDCCIPRYDPRHDHAHHKLERLDKISKASQLEAATLQTLEEERKNAQAEFDRAVTDLQAEFNAIQQDQGYYEEWVHDQAEAEQRANNIIEFWTEETSSRAIPECGAHVDTPLFCSEAYADERDFAYEQSGCIPTAQNSLVTLSYMPYDIEELLDVPSVVNAIQPYATYMQCRFCSNAEPLANWEESSNCMELQMQKVIARRYCKNCKTVEEQEAYYRREKIFIAGQQFDQARLTYETECLSLDVNNRLGRLSADSQRKRCQDFVHNNPDFNTKFVPCGSKLHGVTITGTRYYCLPASLSREYSIASDSSISIAQREYSAFHTKHDGHIPVRYDDYLQTIDITKSCVNNRGSLSFSPCALAGLLKDHCFSIDIIFEEMLSRGLRVDVVHDYLNKAFANGASVRKAMQLFHPHLPAHLLTYASSDCTGYRRQSIDLQRYGQNVFNMRFDVFTDEIEEMVQKQWELAGNAANTVPSYAWLEQNLESTLARAQIPRTEQSFKIVLKHGWECGCTGNQVFDVEASDVDIYDKTGLHQCRACDERTDIVVDSITPLKCGRFQKACQTCTIPTFPNAEHTECIQCGRFEVAQFDTTMLVWNCRRCPPNQYFVDDGGYNLCESIPIMTLEQLDNNRVEIKNFAEWDNYMPDPSRPDIIKKVPQNYYLDLSGEEAILRQCQDTSIINTYRYGCGLTSQIYIKRNNQIVAASDQPGGLITYDADTKQYIIQNEFVDVNMLETGILRGGIIGECERCTKNQYLARPCTSGYPGDPGLCAPCMSCGGSNDCTEQWLDHELESGCNRQVADGLYVDVNEVQATSDYILTKCKFVHVVNGEIFLALGCGNGLVTMWRMPAICVANPLSSGCYSYVNSNSDADQAIDSLHGNTQTVGHSVIYQGFQRDAYTGEWSNVLRNAPDSDEYSEYTDLVPFCPPGHHVVIPSTITQIEDEMLEASLNTFFTSRDWTLHADWCSLCRVDCIDSNAGLPLQRSADWQFCSGSTQEDTQNKCQEGCDLNYYFDEDANKCVQCEMCENSQLVSSFQNSKVHEACNAGYNFNWKTDLCEPE